MISILMISRCAAPPYPAAPDFLHGKACHTILRSLCSLTNRVPLPPHPGDRINCSMLSCRNMAPWLSIHSAPACGGGKGTGFIGEPRATRESSDMLPTGQGGGASHQRGNAGVVHEVYDSLFISSNFLFPLEGKCHVVAKGCTGQSNDVILYRYPDRQSAASLATSWSSPPCKQVALVLISAVVKVLS